MTVMSGRNAATSAATSAVPPILEAQSRRPAEHVLDALDDCEQAHGVRGSTAEVERPAPDAAHALPCADIGVERVVDPKHVTHLLAVAVDGDRIIAQHAQ